MGEKEEDGDGEVCDDPAAAGKETGRGVPSKTFHAAQEAEEEVSGSTLSIPFWISVKTSVLKT